MLQDEQITLKLGRELSASCMVSFSEIHDYGFRIPGVVVVWLLGENVMTSCLS